MNPIYLNACEPYLPFLLSSYDLDPFSTSRGIGDREYWGWKSRDYVNATMQGGVLTLAAFLKLGYFKDNESKMFEIIKSIIQAVKKIQYRNYGVVEIMPYENSFCVAASLVVDILYAIELLDDRLTVSEKEEFYSICKHLITFFSTHIETHGVISNHLAAGVAAIFKYEKMTGDTVFHKQAEDVLRVILANQSKEGWYREYEGADPGYQTLCTYYLAIVFQLTKDSNLLQSLQKSLEFLSYCIHPDGSIGGEYGSRNTQIYYPAGFEILKPHSEIAAAITGFMAASIESQKTVTLNVVDIGNFIPFINNYMIAYLESGKQGGMAVDQLPWLGGDFEKCFAESGLFMVNRSKYYAIIGLKKGGVLKVFNKKTNELVTDDCGYIGELTNEKKVSTQMYIHNLKCQVNGARIELFQSFYSVLENFPTPTKFIVLRLMNVSIMRINWVNKLVKLLLVKLLITNKTKFNITLIRECVFSDDEIVITDNIINSTKYKFKWLDYGQKFSTIHMASSKYFNKHYLVKNKFHSELDIMNFNNHKEITVCNKIQI